MKTPPESDNSHSLVPVPDGSLANTAAGAKRIISAMVGEMLALTRREQSVHTTGPVREAPLSWQHQVVQNHPEIGMAGTDGNRSYVSAYNDAKADLEQDPNCTFDPITLADSVMKVIYEARIAVETAKPESDEEENDPTGKDLAEFDYATVAPVDLDALVREGKKLYRGTAMTQDERNRPEDIQAFSLFLRAAEGGHSEAQYIVSNCYDWEHGVQRDEAKVLDWLRKSAVAGFAEAQDRLGYRYFYGEGMPEDDEEALKWYRKAAEQGFAEGQRDLGFCYAYGKSVQNFGEAVKWYRKAAAQGHAGAQYELGGLYLAGEIVPINLAESAKWYREAAEQGDAYAQCILGDYYRNGTGVLQDNAEAVKWYRKAAEQGNAWAQSHLGFCYTIGNIVPKDVLQAYKWLQLAADQGEEGAKEDATSLAALMSPSEFDVANALYQEFKETHPAKQ